MIKVILLNRDKTERNDWNKPLSERGKLIFETEKDLNVYDILSHDQLIIAKDAISKIEEVFA